MLKKNWKEELIEWMSLTTSNMEQIEKLFNETSKKFQDCAQIALDKGNEAAVYAAGKRCAFCINARRCSMCLFYSLAGDCLAPENIQQVTSYTFGDSATQVEYAIEALKVSKALEDFLLVIKELLESRKHEYYVRVSSTYGRARIHSMTCSYVLDRAADSWRGKWEIMSGDLFAICEELRSDYIWDIAVCQRCKGIEK